MGKKIVLYDLEPSPNNIKVRIALNYKGLEFDKIPVDPMDRSGVLEASGQPLTPVMLHGDTVVYDSAAILRYLDTNFRDTPPLFSADYETMQEIESLETMSRSRLSEPIGMIYRQWRSGEPDPAVSVQASAMANDLTADIEARLAEGHWLVGDSMTAADVSAAPLVFYMMVPPEVADSSPPARFFADNLHLGEGRGRTGEWVARVMAYDRQDVAVGQD